MRTLRTISVLGLLSLSLFPFASTNARFLAAKRPLSVDFNRRIVAFDAKSRRELGRRYFDPYQKLAAANARPAR